MSNSEPQPQPPLRWIVPSLGSVLVLTALTNALLFRGGYLFAVDGDVGRHIRVGRTIIDRGVIPQVDLFSHTRAGEPFVPYEWLSEVITALADVLIGLPGVAVLSALLYVAAVLAVYRTAELLGATRFLAFFAGLLALVMQSVHLLPRPHLFTTALAGLFVLLLVRFSRGGNAWTLAPLPVLMLFWANSHGGFIVGFIVLGAFLVGALLGSSEFESGRHEIRSIGMVFLLCLVASLLNPAGITLWEHTTGYLGIEFLVAETHEYRSPDFHKAYGKIFFILLFAGPALWMTGRVRVSQLGAGLYLFFAATALHSARNIPLFTVAVLPWLATWMQDALAAGGRLGQGLLERFRALEQPDRRLKPGLPTLLAMSLIAYSLGSGGTRFSFSQTRFPVEAMGQLTQIEKSGRVFNQMIWGGYLLYAHPEIPVFIDGQTDFYGEELSREYLIALKGRPGWRHVLSKYEVSWTLTGRSEPLNQLLEIDPNWVRSYEDSVAIVFRRAD